MAALGFEAPPHLPQLSSVSLSFLKSKFWCCPSDKARDDFLPLNRMTPQMDIIHTKMKKKEWCLCVIIQIPFSIFWQHNEENAMNFCFSTSSKFWWTIIKATNQLFLALIIIICNNAKFHTKNIMNTHCHVLLHESIHPFNVYHVHCRPAKCRMDSNSTSLCYK